MYFECKANTIETAETKRFFAEDCKRLVNFAAFEVQFAPACAKHAHEEAS